LGEVDWYHGENSTFIAVAFVNYKYPIVRPNQVEEQPFFFPGKLVQTCTQEKLFKKNILLKILKSLVNFVHTPKKEFNSFRQFL
jgi:hypothetical protein